VWGIIGTLTMVNLDFVIDPVAVAADEWQWATNGRYFGIPLTNFIGWFITSLAIMTLFWPIIQTWQSVDYDLLLAFDVLFVYIIVILQLTVRSAVYGVYNASWISLFFTLCLCAIVML
jgi:putative membrane protein